MGKLRLVMGHEPNMSPARAQTPAELRNGRDRLNMAELRRFKLARDFTCQELGDRLGCSADSVERYLSGKRPVPGHVVAFVRVELEHLGAERKRAA